MIYYDYAIIYHMLGGWNPFISYFGVPQGTRALTRNRCNHVWIRQTSPPKTVQQDEITQPGSRHIIIWMNQRNLWPDAIVSDAKSSMDNLDLENLRERFLWNRAGASFVMFFCDVVLVSSHGTANPELTLNLAEEFAFLTFPGMLSGTQDSESKCLSAEAKCRGQITILAMDVWSIGI